MKKWIAIFIGLAAAVGLMLAAAGAWIKSRQMSVAIIGGADGPTSIFVAGKINGAAFMEAGAILVAGGLVIGRLLFWFSGGKESKAVCFMTGIPIKQMKRKKGNQNEIRCENGYDAGTYHAEGAGFRTADLCRKCAAAALQHG